MLPDSFEELSSDQYIQIADILFQGGDTLECYTKALRILAGMSRISFMLMDPEMVDRCLPFINWVFETKKVITQLLPEYKGYHGPVSDFDNLKMKEFHFSEMYYGEVMAQPLNPLKGTLEDPINKLTSVIYRQGKFRYDRKMNPDGDVRIPFNANEIEFNSRIIHKWPDAVKHAIFFWYHSCRQQLIDNNPLVFTEPGDNYTSQFNTGLYGVMRSLAGDKLGTIDKIEDMYVHTAMLELGLLKEEEIRIEEQRKANP